MRLFAVVPLTFVFNDMWMFGFLLCGDVVRSCCMRLTATFVGQGFVCVFCSGGGSSNNTIHCQSVCSRWRVVAYRVGFCRFWRTGGACVHRQCSSQRGVPAHWCGQHETFGEWVLVGAEFGRKEEHRDAQDQWRDGSSGHLHKYVDAKAIQMAMHSINVMPKSNSVSAVDVGYECKRCVLDVVGLEGAVVVTSVFGQLGILDNVKFAKGVHQETDLRGQHHYASQWR